MSIREVKGKVMRLAIVSLLVTMANPSLAVMNSANNLVLLECMSSTKDSKGFFVIETENDVRRATAFIDTRELRAAKILLTGDRRQNLALFLYEEHPSEQKWDYVGIANLDRETLDMRIEWGYQTTSYVTYACDVMSKKVYESFPQKGSTEYLDDYMFPIWDLLEKQEAWLEEIQGEFKL